MQVSSLPSVPGVYAFRGADGVSLYIGKAKRLNARISAHLGLSDSRPPKTRRFLAFARVLELIPTASEMEAILLEARLIHEFQPKYNSRLRDDKSPLYIVVTKTPIPTLTLYRRRDLSTTQHQIFGPFTSGRDARLVVKTVRRILPFCSRVRNDGHPCFYVHLGLCPGVCIGRMSQREYRQRLKEIVAFLSGNIEGVSTRLIVRMRDAAARGLFEQAARVRDALIALDQLRTSSRFLMDDVDLMDASHRVSRLSSVLLRYAITLPASKTTRIEAVDVSRLGPRDVTFAVVSFVGGVPDSSGYRNFRLDARHEEDDAALIADGLTRRFLHPEWELPSLVVVDGGEPQLRTIAKARIPSFSMGHIPMIGLAKKQETIVIPVAHTFLHLKLPRTDPGLQLLMHCRDEAHRFARRYHHWLRSKALIQYNQGL